MSTITKIEWTNSTWNPTRGCSRISPGCANCYAETVAHRFGGDGMPYEGLTRIVNGRPTWTGEVRQVNELLDQPLRWTKPRRIFVNSMSDLFHDGVPDDFLPYVFSVMAVAKRHVFQILTKRPERMRKVVNDYAFFDTVSCFAKHGHGVEITAEDWPLPNVWLGVSVENQVTADERIPLLLDTQAAIRWISAEPLLGWADISRWLRPRQRQNADGYGGDFSPGWTTDFTKLDWVVAGGESGRHARPSHPEWFRTLRDQCNDAGAPFLFKQWGEWAPRGGKCCGGGTDFSVIDPRCTRWPRVIRLGEHGLDTRISENCIDGMGEEIFMQMVGKKSAGRLLDGKVHDAYPAS